MGEKIKFKGLKIFVLIFASILLLVCMMSTHFSFTDFNYNSKFVFESGQIIYSQDRDVGDFKFGGLGTVAHNGCGVVAVYNILTLSGKKPVFAEVIKSADLGGTFAFGKLGTNPLWIMNYLRRRGFKVGICMKTECFEQKAKQSKYSIILTLNEKSGHYWLIKDYNNLNGQFSFMNPNVKMSMTEFLNKYSKPITWLIYVN